MAVLTEAAQRTQRISNQYDRDTRNGKVATQQALWAARVRRWYSTGFKEW